MKVLRKEVFFFIGGVFLTPLLFSKVHFDVVDSKLWSKSLKEACKLLNKGPLLVEKLSLKSFDCMGSKVFAKDFCLKMLREKKIHHKNFLRGFVSNKNTVSCQMGTFAVLSLPCVKGKMKGLCQIDNVCEKMRESYAWSFSLMHSKKFRNKISCYYSPK